MSKNNFQYKVYNSKFKNQDGFTLIELLVVIAIVGVLASVVLLSLGGVKNKNKDASVKTQLNQARTQADLFYTTSGNYTNVCTTASDSATPPGINAYVLNAAKVVGINIVNVNGGGTVEARCNSASAGWAAQVPLSNGTSYYCVDYTRKGIITSTSIGNSNAFCS